MGVNGAAALSLPEEMAQNLSGLELTCVDATGRRVAGTGVYALDLEKPISGNAFYHVLSTGRPAIVESARESELCLSCWHRNSCQEKASILVPVFDGDRVTGAVGIIARTEEQRIQMLSGTPYYLDALWLMSKLMGRFKVTGGLHKPSFEFIARNRKMLELLKQARDVAAGEATVLITGESGTGKEVLARYLHAHSPRRDYPFVVINCGAIPDHLLESELFGYEPGAFTGANRRGKVGKLELADKGTAFLDEIGDMPLLLQTKILRVIQEKEIERLGSTSPRKLDIRWIAATNRDLKSMVREGSFREDLYYRLAVIPFELPPLRSRTEDIGPLAEHFLEGQMARLGKRFTRISEGAMQILKGYSWPGNIRELQNVIEYAANMEKGDVITESSLPANLARASRVIDPDQRGAILEKLRQHGRSVEAKKKIAREMGISLATLYRRLKEMEMN